MRTVESLGATLEMRDSTDLQSRGGSDDFLKHGGFVDFFTESRVFLLKSVFTLLAIFNVGSCAIPTCYLSTLVFKRI